MSLSGATIPASGSCVFSVDVKGAAGGDFVNTTGAVTSANGGTGNTATANLSVTVPPTVTKAFGVSTMPERNDHADVYDRESEHQRVDGDRVHGHAAGGINGGESGPGLTATCDGSIVANAGAGSISIAGANLNASANCTFTVKVTGTAAGNQQNTTGAITAAETGAGLPSNTATLTVVAPPAITKAFTAASIPVGGTTALTFTITNPAANTVALTASGSPIRSRWG